MRLPESKIKEAILNPNADVRERAVRYFDDSFSRDVSIMPLVIEAVERYGREEAYHLIGGSINLPQTEDTISWIIDELKDERSDSYESYTYNLLRVIQHADPTLLVPRKSEILDARHVERSFQKSFQQRLEVLSWNEATCWQKLEIICEKGKDKQYTNEVDLGLVDQILEALARIGGQSEERIFSVLSEKITDFENNPLKWMEPFMVQLAGLLRLESAVPIVLEKFHIDDDVLLERCQETLIRIGTDVVVEGIANAYDHAEEYFRLYATTILENIHTDLAATASLRFFGTEKVSLLKRGMAHAALNHFTREAIEPVRQYLLTKRLQGDFRHLRNYLVETCTIMEKRFPEYEEWLAAEKKDREEHQQTIRELGGDPQALLTWSIKKLSEISSAEEDEPDPKLKNSTLPPLGSLPVSSLPSLNAETRHERVGRNDPCPCGSGKKFKKCCLKKQGSSPLD